MTRTFSLSPLFGTTIGFDRFDDLFDTLSRAPSVNDGHPPYNIERENDDRYTITLAVAGFADAELNISLHDNDLVVSGERAGDNGSTAQYLYQGFGLRNFKRTFRLADYVVVKGAELKDGLLRIDLAREVPEAQKPRKIEIRTKPELKAIGNSKKVA